MSLDLSIPKIETESKGDILHLTSTLSTAASTKLSKCIANKELAAAKSLGSKFADNEFVEEKRRVCAGHLSEWAELLFTMGGENILINNCPFEQAFQASQRMEPLDLQLRNSLQTLELETRKTFSKAEMCRKSIPVKIGEVLGEIMELKRRVAAKEVGEGGCLESGADMKKSGAMKWVVEPEEIKGWENVPTLDPTTTTITSQNLKLLNDLITTVPAMPTQYHTVNNIINDLMTTSKQETTPRRQATDSIDNEEDDEDIGNEGSVDQNGNWTPRRARSGLVKRLKRSENNRGKPY